MTSQQPRYTLSKDERIYAQKRIETIFSGSESFIAYPLRVVFTRREVLDNEPSIAMLVSVSKRRFKRANKRNAIKRLVRESFRLNKHALNDITELSGVHLDIAFLYLNNELPSFEEIEKSMQKTINILKEKLVKKNSDEDNS